MPVAQQVMILYAAVNGYIDDVDVEKVKGFEAGLQKYCLANGKALLDKIAKEKQLTKEIEEEVKKVIQEYKETIV